ncbi:crossover junction endonuclease MUS81 isoform X2 [Benincasa hispida]|uniref:crossover junction endonuclease MUS81 isoform X2 n=1 Tax=Benincasa hispida TaxID=102211 RepID=UPI0019027B58|nr:crossover junction endonuclease MUS81 isoform X2 [Benincasa hispida]
MDRQRSPVVCPENEDIATFMWQKRLEMAATPKGISDKVDMTLYKAYFNVCNSKVPIKSMKDLSQIKYMLTEEGQQVARECLMRSGLLSSTKNVDNTKGSSILESCDISDHSANSLDSDVEVTSPTAIKSSQNKSTDVPLESLERFMRMGYSKHQVLDSFKEVSEDNPNKDISSLWPAVLCRLREDLVYGQVEAVGRENRLTSSSSSHDRNGPKIVVNDNGERFFNLRACSSSNPSISSESCRDGVKANMNILSMPPLSFGEKFEDSYNVVLILDDREQFANHSSRSRRMIENICSQFKIQIEIRRLPVGDGIWIARHKHLDNEYVLDFIVERKNIDDLRCSIRDNRYRDQKLKLLRCGLKRMIYLVEGDPNSSEAAESIKTACFTTEILEGFDVQRTSGLSDTLKKYGYLTRAITQYYILQASDERLSHSDVCPRLNEFIKKCQELDKMTVSDVFALQLMQVPQVTEEVAVAVLELYPTLLSLARAYSLLDGNVTEQEEMLRRQSNNLINAGASRNIFHLVWGCGK